MSPARVYRCTGCPWQMWDASNEDVDDHWRTAHAPNTVVVRHDHGPGPELNCEACRAALAEYDRYAEPKP